MAFKWLLRGDHSSSLSPGPSFHVTFAVGVTLKLEQTCSFCGTIKSYIFWFDRIFFYNLTCFTLGHVFKCLNYQVFSECEYGTNSLMAIFAHNCW